ncbi:MAG: HD domain-containing protein [Candidatus Hodarchaeales archaeon]|jgi:uncharacterized protein
MEEKYLELKEIVEKELSCSAHDLDHVLRVYNTCVNLARDEKNIDLDVLISAALLHDIARVKEDRDPSRTIDHAILGAEMARTILTNLDYPEDKILAIKHCITSHRYRSDSDNMPRTREAKILFDADKLDVLGAVGVARSFVVAGEYAERIYSHVSVDEYVRSNLVDGKLGGRIKDFSKHAPNLEYETKFQLIPDKLYTDEAKSIAKERLAYMDTFFARLRKEINGEL